MSFPLPRAESESPTEELSLDGWGDGRGCFMNDSSMWPVLDGSFTKSIKGSTGAIGSTAFAGCPGSEDSSTDVPGKPEVVV
jgi:hypothetical protein